MLLWMAYYLFCKKARRLYELAVLARKGKQAKYRAWGQHWWCLSVNRLSFPGLLSRKVSTDSSQNPSRMHYGVYAIWYSIFRVCRVLNFSNKNEDLPFSMCQIIMWGERVQCGTILSTRKQSTFHISSLARLHFVTRCLLGTMLIQDSQFV